MAMFIVLSLALAALRAPPRPATRADSVRMLTDCNRPPRPATRAGSVRMLTDCDRTTWCRDVEGADGLAVVYFFAPWCRNCKAVKPRLERLEREFSSSAKFYQVDFKASTDLAYEQRVFSFPAVHLYLPGVGRVARSVLTGPTTEAKLRPLLERFGGGGPQRQLLEAVAAAALAPVVRYTELVGALRSLAELGSATTESAEPPKPSLSGARLRSIIEGDEQRLAELEELFTSLDADADGRLRLGELEAALEHLPSGVASVGDVVQRLGDSDTSLSVDKPTFVSLMVERAVADFGAGEAALLPAFEALDADGSGTVTQQQLLSAVDELCAAWPEAEGCALDHRQLRLGLAYDAFANDEKLLDYERFVEMVAGWGGGADHCAVDDGEAPAAATSSYLKEQAENMGERECFGAAVDEAGEDIACDAWFYGEDPTVEKEEVAVDAARLEALKEEGRDAVAARRRREAEAAEFQERMRR